MALEQPSETNPVSEAARALGRKRAETLTPEHQSNAAQQLAALLSPEQRRTRASNAAKARWNKYPPEGTLNT